MVITRDDVLTNLVGSDQSEEKQKEIENLTDKEMQFMADRMTDMMMETYWASLENAYNDLKYEKERQKKMFESVETKEELIADIEYMFIELYDELRNNQLGLNINMNNVQNHINNLKSHIDNLMTEIKKSGDE